MFSTLKSRLLLGIYVFVILSIPVGAYLASQNQTYKSSASEGKKTIVKRTPSPLPLPDATQSASTSEEAANTSGGETKSLPGGESEPTLGVNNSPTIATSFGPTLSLKVNLEGRPETDQSTKLFVGIVEGELSTNPKFLLSFSVTTAKDGSYSNLSLAGLSPGTKYTALLKGATQIATSSAFIMTPTVTNLNTGEAINMLTGDLNEDNVINSSDYNIAQKAIGAILTSSNWNENVDFNKDGIINLFDLGLLSKNIGQVGVSGTWTSPLPKVASPSGSLATPGMSSQGGYWIWVPK